MCKNPKSLSLSLPSLYSQRSHHGISQSHIRQRITYRFSITALERIKIAKQNYFVKIKGAKENPIWVTMVNVLGH